MAGYFLYSLDYDLVTKFIKAPSGKAFDKLAQRVSDRLDGYDDQIDDGAVVAEWPSEPSELKPILKARLALKDWYKDLCDTGKLIWEQSFTDVCMQKGLLGFQSESDGIYWNIVEEAMKFHQVRGSGIGPLELTHFGTRPFHYLHRGKRTYGSWYPSHSMHTPDEVRKLRDQFAAAESAILASRHDEVRGDYEELMPVLDKLSTSKRILYVSVDT